MCCFFYGVVCIVILDVVHLLHIREVVLTLRFLIPARQACNQSGNTSNRPVSRVRAAALEIDPVPGMGHKGIMLRVAPWG